MDAINLVLSRLDRVHSRGTDKYAARCPAHDDSSPSLSIKRGDDGRLLLYCFAGCTVHDICDSLGIHVRDLFAPMDPRLIEATKQQRQKREMARRTIGWQADMLREAERLIEAASGIDIANWSANDLDTALGKLAASYDVLEGEALNG